MCRLQSPGGALEFRTTLTLDENWVPIVSAFGEIDLATSSMFVSALCGAASRAADLHVIADMRGVEFMDLGGVKALLAAHEDLRALSPGGRLLVVSAGHIKWLIELLDPEERLYLCLDLPEAKNALVNLGASRN